MKIKKMLVRSAVALITVPLVLLLIGIVWIKILDRTNGTIVSSGEEREYLLYVPPAYDRTQPMPLVVSFHAGATWPAQQKNLSGWNRLADEHGFIVVYPSGRGEIGALDLPRVWPVERDADRTRDLAFVSALIDSLEASYNIDPRRIYANGMSQGGAMAFALSCALPERIAAVGMVAAAHAQPFEWVPQ